MPATPVEISQLWRHVNRHMRELFHSMVAGSELPMLSFLLLRRIEDEPGITLSELARKVGAAKSHVSNMVEHLVCEGLIEKRSDPSDQRLLRLHLTDAARRRFEGIEDRAQAAWRMVLDELPENDIDEVARFLRTLLEALKRANERVAEGRAADEFSAREHEVTGR